MRKLCIFICVTLLGWLGWWLGAKVGGVMTAFTVSGAGSLAGVYLGWRVNRELFE